MSVSRSVCIPLTSTDQLIHNFMNALAGNSPREITWSSPDSHPSNAFDNEELLLGDEDLMLPAAAVAYDCTPPLTDATVVTTTSWAGTIEPPAIMTAAKAKKATGKERRHALPSSVILSESKNGNTLTQSVPEFLCHLFTMLRDENLHDVMSWEVPTENETDPMGGGIKGIGKIVCHQPDVLQESVLGNYYRHSKYASFQRQLNYFGFKKRLHGGKKGKLSPCSYVHEGLDANIESLLRLKRRSALKKRLSMEIDSNSVSSNDEEPEEIERPKKRRSSDKDKSSNNKSMDKIEPIAVYAEEFEAPAEILSNNVHAASRHVQVPSALTQRIMVNPAPASATLAQLLSTALPPSEELFDDNFPGFDDAAINEGNNANGVYVNDQGRCFSQNSLVNLAMFY